MLEIKTITMIYPDIFDAAVNGELKNGWELVRRECFITGSDRAATFYAELERVIDDPVEEDAPEEIEDDVAQWLITRNPRNPYKCSNCGYTANLPWGTCPNCKSVMLSPED